MLAEIWILRSRVLSDRLFFYVRREMSDPRGIHVGSGAFLEIVLFDYCSLCVETGAIT